MQGQWIQWTDTVLGTVHIYFFMNGACACPGYPKKAFDNWTPGKVLWVG